VVAAFLLLTLALVALWIGGEASASTFRRHLWLGLFAASLAAAMAAGIVQPSGLVWIAGFAGATWLFGRAETAPALRVTAAVGIVLLATGLMTHRLPGFANPVAMAAGQITSDAAIYRLHLNYDKTLVGLFLLGWCHDRIARAAEWRRMAVGTAPVAAGLIVTIIGLALAVGYVRFEPKFPRETWLWMWVNLCFTCVAEEALFRGFVQAQLARRWQRFRGGEWAALLVAAVLFGVAHVAGGFAYVGLATIAGIGYGWVYLRTRRIEASILTHFALNAVHFLGFTYPALQRS
jgi:uncharacterized protein